MKRLTAVLLAVLMAAVSQAIHAEGKTDAPLSFWDKLRSKIEQITPQKKVTATTAVGGVRGAKMATDDVYWKGEKVAQAVDADELDAFKQAIALTAAGEFAQAQAAFAAFIAKNPDSPLRKDADQALAELQAAQ